MGSGAAAWRLASRLRAAAAARPAASDAGLAVALYLLLTFGVTTAGELERAGGRLLGAAVNVVLDALALQQAELAVAAERARIARELHDVVAHHVSVMVALADGAQLAAAEDPDSARAAMGHVAAIGRDALTELRDLLGVLRGGDRVPPALGPQPGVAQLDELLDRVRGAGLAARLRVEGAPVPLGPVAELTVYRVVQEALTNVLRHARGARAAEVHLRYSPEELELEVVDDGRAAAAANGEGRGLAGMRERAAVHGARLEAGPRPAGGWRVAVRLPVRAGAGAR